MTIEVNGQPVEAFRLIMQKNNALDILSGKKKLEIRSFTDNYISMFCDSKLLKEQEKLAKKGEDVFIEDAFKDVEYVRFTNYNQSWFLDVKIGEMGLAQMTKDWIQGLAEDFDFHDLDNEWQQYEKSDEVPNFFYLEISEIVNQYNMK